MGKLNLKQALEQDKLSDFIKQNKDLKGDKQRLEQAIKAMSKSSKSVRQTSTEGSKVLNDI